MKFADDLDVRHPGHHPCEPPRPGVQLTEATSLVTEAGSPPGPDMVRIPGGTFQIGSGHYPEETLAHPVRAGRFWIGRHPVTNAASGGDPRRRGCLQPATQVAPLAHHRQVAG